jgi:hypothetical protein
MDMQEIRTTEELVAFLRQVDNFHDAIVRECSLLAHGFVDEEYNMHGDAKPFDAKVFLQTQFAELPGLEIEFSSVSHFYVEDIMGLRPGGSIENGIVRFSFVERHTKEPQVVASGMRYRLLDKACLGSGAFYRGEREKEA